MAAGDVVLAADMVKNKVWKALLRMRAAEAVFAISHLFRHGSRFRTDDRVCPECWIGRTCRCDPHHIVQVAVINGSASGPARGFQVVYVPRAFQ